LVGWSGSFLAFPVGWLVGWLLGSFPAFPVGWLVGWLVGELSRGLSWFVPWLVGFQLSWLS